MSRSTIPSESALAGTAPKKPTNGAKAASTPPAPQKGITIPTAVRSKGLNTVSVLMAVRGLGANKLRAFLTMLGVIIGVGAVIVAIAIGQGSREAVAQSLRTLGTNTLNVMAGQQKRGGIGFGFGSRSTLKPADADAIKKECTTIARVCPQVQGNAQVKYADKNTNTSVYGQGQEYPLINNHRIRTGRFLNIQDIKARKRVAVLGATTATDLFDQQSPIGKAIRVAGQKFEVIGVFQKKGGGGFRNPDDGVYIPYTTAMRRLLGTDSLQGITCQAVSEQAMKRAETEIGQVLRRRHKLADGADDDFLIFNQADLAEAQNEQQNTFSALITYLAIVSLVVGGVGIMNIMLVSVTERTREIGVRKAIGAKRRDILSQFLLEALFLSLIGGVLGVVAGVGGAKLVQAVNNWTVVIAPATVLMAFSFSAVVGAFFGFYPAWKASQLNPIEALRYE